MHDLKPIVRVSLEELVCIIRMRCHADRLRRLKALARRGQATVHFNLYEPNEPPASCQADQREQGECTDPISLDGNWGSGGDEIDSQTYEM